MSTTRPPITTSRYLRQLGLLGIGMLMVLASCGGEATAPSGASGRVVRGLSFRPVFPAMSLSGGASDFTAFNTVHVALHHADGSVAIDTTIVFPVDSQQITISLNVTLAAAAPPSGEPLTLDLGYLNAVGDVVFKGGPVTVLAAPSIPGSPPPSPITISVAYTGVGANAKSVRISPRGGTTTVGKAFAYTATGLDGSGNPVPNTPIVWTSLDPTMATMSSTGTGLAIKRGTARIVAQLIVGSPAPADTVYLAVVPTPSSISLVSGSGQSGVVQKATPTVLAKPLVVNVKASDGLPVPGVGVSFATATGSGSVSSSVATTDANGDAQVSWTLGNTVGNQTATATLAGVSGSPVTFTATATASVATQLAISAAPGSNVMPAAPITFAVVAQDAGGDPVTGFTGPVSVALSSNPSNATLAGTATVNAVNGVATFANLSIAAPGTGYVLTASSPNLASVASPAFNVGSGVPTKLTVISGGSQNALPGAVLQPVVVGVTDALGNPVANVTVSFSVATGGGSLAWLSAMTDALGRASTVWTLGSSPGPQTLSIGAGSLPVLTVTATAVATQINLQSGFNQTGTLGQQLAQPIVAKVTDVFGNPVIGTTVTYTVASGGGTVTPTSVITSATGLASAQWTLGATGAQAVTVALSTLPAPPVVVTANTASAVVQALVSPKPDTLVAIGATQQMTVQGLNASSQPVAGTWTWVSRDPAIATVSASGLVTAASNGSTYIVATENGGAKDSSPTVVKQRIAKINVTPANRSLFVGGFFSYAAQAIDANNVVLATQPTFAWTSTSPQVASVSATTGAVQALSVGSTQISASSGSAVGNASLTVNPSITAIRVTYDSAGAPAPDVATLTSLGARRPYRAIALDTLGAAMSGVTFTWSTGVPGVAQLDMVQPDRARATALANGTTGINASAQGIRGEASLRVVVTGQSNINNFIQATDGQNPGNLVRPGTVITQPSAAGSAPVVPLIR